MRVIRKHVVLLNILFDLGGATFRNPFLRLHSFLKGAWNVLLWWLLSCSRLFLCFLDFIHILQIAFGWHHLTGLVLHQLRGLDLRAHLLGWFLPWGMVPSCWVRCLFVDLKVKLLVSKRLLISNLWLTSNRNLNAFHGALLFLLLLLLMPLVLHVLIESHWIVFLCLLGILRFLWLPETCNTWVLVGYFEGPGSRWGRCLRPHDSHLRYLGSSDLFSHFT